MKQTIDTNLAGIKFTFDKDAYTMLDEYLTTLDSLFRKSGEDSSETVADIEARCAELICAEHDPAFYIVTVRDVASIIDRLGNPEEVIAFCMEEGRKESKATPPPYNAEPAEEPQPIRHKIYRAPWDKMLGGVCGGIAAYFGLDSTYVRLAWIILTIITATVPCMVYLILWVIVPEARTPLQRLELQGETPSLENIGETITEAFRNGLDKKSEPQTVGARIVRVAANIFKIVLCAVGIMAIPVLIAILMGIVAIAWFMVNLALGTGFVPDELLATTHPYLHCIFLMMILLLSGAIISLPLYAGMMPMLGKRCPHHGRKWVWIVLTAAILCAATIFGYSLL